MRRLQRRAPVTTIGRVGGVFTRGAMTVKCGGRATTVDDLIKLLLCCCRHNCLGGLRKEERVTAPLLRL